MTFGEKLKQARKDSGYSQEELAEILCVSRSAIAKWETDKGMPDVSNLQMIAKTLSVSTDYLLADDEPLYLDVTRETINLDDREEPKGSHILAKDKRKEAIVREKYPDAEIYRLHHYQIKNKRERVVQNVLWLTTPIANTVDIMHSVNNMDKMFFLADQSDKQYLVEMNDEVMESRRLSKRVTTKRGKKFVAGKYEFINAGILKDNKKPDKGRL